MEKVRMKRILVLVMGLTVSGLAWSESWVGLNAAQLERDNGFYRAQKERIETDELFLRIGADMNDIFGSELRLGATPEATEEFGHTFEHSHLVGGYLRAQYELGFVSPYVITGITEGKQEVVFPSGARDTRSFDDISIGAGIDFTFGDHFGINAEYMRYYDIGTVSLRGPSAGLYWQF
jgi:opacity protein-like surface antigen